MRFSSTFVLLGIFTLSSFAQKKPGDCPVSTLSVCHQSCRSDSSCPGMEKCCKTSCGGSVCTSPITMRKPEIFEEKAGFCPQYPSGPWVCTSRCAFDGDCRGRLKCCKNRCGALTCTPPEP